MPLVWTTWALQKLEIESEVQERKSKMNNRKGAGGQLGSGRGQQKSQQGKK